MKTVRFYTLLYIDTEHRSLSHNGVAGNFDEQMKTFVRCTEVLARSLFFFEKQELTVLTNNAAYINNLSKSLKCVEIEFTYNIPKDIGFFAAHRKLDVIKYLSRQNAMEYHFLLDSDVLCINRMPINLRNCLDGNLPVYYDITDQVYPAYGREAIIKTKELILPGVPSIGLWSGGEFIGGDSQFFKLLSTQIDLIYPNYLANYKSLHHQGDEALVSVVLEQIMKDKFICNAGVFGGIRRYWSDQIWRARANLKRYDKDFLIHLPADKKFIAEVSTVDEKLIYQYRRYLNRVTLLVAAKNGVKRILKLIKNDR